MTYLSIVALGGLTASSLNEDPYGYVQHDIAKVLDALVGTLVDVEHFIQSPPQSYHSLPRLLDDSGVWTEPNSVMRGKWMGVYLHRQEREENSCAYCVLFSPERFYL